MSNVIAGVVRGQIPHLEEHIAQKKAIFERYKEGFKDLPVKMNPFDPETTVPNYWLSCMTIDEDAMCQQMMTDTSATYVSEAGKSCPTEILEAIAAANAEGRPIWKPMHMQPIYRDNPFVAAEQGNDVGADIFRRGLCLPSDNKMTPAEQDVIIQIIRSCFN
jgi:dTDP-4-amino-4,6-dideoxygalactose transaminase